MAYLTIGRTIVCVAVVLVGLVAQVRAAGWFDDFDDGSATDGSPVTSTPEPRHPGNYDASSGDYLLEPLNPGVVDETMITTVDGTVLGDTSIRTQARIFGGGGILGVAARFDPATLTGYTANLSISPGSSDGYLMLLRVDGPQAPSMTETLS